MDKRNQLEKKGSKRLRGPLMRLRRASTKTPEQAAPANKEKPHRRPTTTKASRQRSQTRSTSSVMLGSVESLEGYEDRGTAHGGFERNNESSERTRKYQSWKEQALRDDPTRSSGIHKAKSSRALVRAERMLDEPVRAPGNRKAKSARALVRAERMLEEEPKHKRNLSMLSQESSASGLGDAWLTSFLQEGYEKPEPKPEGDGSEMELDLSPLMNLDARGSDSSMKLETEQPKRRESTPTGGGTKPRISSAAIAQSLRNLAMERYIEEQTKSILDQQSEVQHKHHEGHHGNQSVSSRRLKTAVVKATLERETTC